ncbi:hypothetical protein [Streptomyces sp. NPDC051909]|uniref:hypothetical protein n=1 Tax=Streptomyces sp. NPDC051909 TaxID=3154944 RepID=UPI0034324758
MPLAVPVLPTPSGLTLRPWRLTDLPLRTAEQAGFRREGLLRGWRQVGAERRDMYVYGQLLQAGACNS